MAFIEEFQMQWKNVAAFLESEMITQSKEKRKIDLSDIGQKFESEKGRWFVPGQFQYAWMELLRKDSSECAEEFERELKKLKFHQIQSEKATSGVFVIVGAVVGAAVGLGASALFKLSLIFSCMCVVVLVLMGGFTGNNLNNVKREQICDEERKQYMRQLQEMQDVLADIIRKADI